MAVRLPLLFVLNMLVIAGIMISWVYLRFQTRMLSQYDRMAEGITELVANAYDGDKVDDYIKYNFELPDYVDTVNYLYTLRDNFPDVLYLYIYRFEEDGGHVVIDLDADWWEDGEGYEPGYIWGLDEIEEPFASHLSEFAAGEKIAGYAEHSKADGYLYTYTRPVFKSDGSYSSTICVDFSMDYLSGMDRNFTIRLSLFWLLVIIIVLALDFYIVRKRITTPINRLSSCAGSFSYDTDEDRLNNLKLLDELNINTGDEIEDVYHVLKSVTHDSFKATENLIQTKSDLRDKEGMITAMAADYRSIYYVNLDKDEATCMRAVSDAYNTEMWEGRIFPYWAGFANYAEHIVADSDREDFLRFIEPDNIRKGLANEVMISHRYLVIYDGVEKYEMIRIAGVRTIEDRDDNIVHAVGMGFSDVDKQTRDELEHNRALTEAMVEAKEANAAKTAFLSSMSHEIRTPMNAIIGLDKIALNDPSISDTTRSELEKIGASAQHLLSLINDILDMSRIESGRMVLSEEEFSFRQMLEQIDIMINGQCMDKKLTYNSKVIGDVDDYFIGDTLRIRQIIINILGNAVKYTDSPGTVTFTVEEETDTDESCILHFTMKDTGIGMDEAFIPKLFDAFAQEDATTTNRYGGSGLGMAITKNMIDLMKGSIAVESEKGCGTTVSVDIPIKRAHHVEAPSDVETSGVESVSLSGICVLIAEDMAVNANILMMMLEMEGIVSEWAENGQLAVERFAESEAGHFDAVLMDMRMPVMDGVAATREIRKLDRPDAKSIPIIALTANAFEEDVKLCLEAGMNSHLSKPVDMDLLKENLGRLLKQ